LSNIKAGNHETRELRGVSWAANLTALLGAMEDAGVGAAAEVAEIAYNGTPLEPFIQSIKQKVGSKEGCDTYIFEAPNPTISSKLEKAGSSSAFRYNAPRVEPFKIWGCTVIVLSWQSFFKIMCLKSSPAFETVARPLWSAMVGTQSW
jgi:hypothetical protein